MRKAFLLLGLLLAAGLIAAGCGDDDETTTTGPTTGGPGTLGQAETKEHWIATADEVCRNAETEVQRAAKQQGISESSSPDDLRTFSETVVVRVQQSVIDTLRALGPPKGEEEPITELLDAVQSALDTVEDDPDLLADPQLAEEEFAEADQLAVDYGLEECGD
jgi:hypothetical protein